MLKRFLLPACSEVAGPAGGARQPLSAVPASHSTCSTCPALTLLLRHTPNHSLAQAPPTTAEQPGYSQHVLSKQASCTQIERERETGPRGTVSWRVALECRSIFSSQPLSFLEREELLGLGWLCCESVSSYILKSVTQSWRRCSELWGGTVEWTQHGVRGGLQLCLQGWVYTLTCQSSGASHQPLKGLFCNVLLPIKSHFLVKY